MKTYHRHYCTRKHRTYETAAKCLWPRAVWIHGEGPYAVLAWCGSGPSPGPALTITLWDDLTDAENAKKAIDYTGCGGRCEGEPRHKLIHLDLEGLP